MPKPLHQRLRDIIPKSVETRIPEKLKPPAWREPKWTPPPEALEQEDLTFVWGDPAMVVDDVVAHLDSKGKPLPTPLQIPRGTRGRMVGVGPDFVVMEFGEDDPTYGAEAQRYRIPKQHVVNMKPKKERKLGRRVIEVGLADLR